MQAHHILGSGLGSYSVISLLFYGSMQSPAHLDARGGELSSTHLWRGTDEATLKKTCAKWDMVPFLENESRQNSRDTLQSPLWMGHVKVACSQKENKASSLVLLGIFFGTYTCLGISAFNLQVYLL